jgi:hypothetical protein
MIRKIHEKNNAGIGINSTSNKSIFEGVINNPGWRNVNREEQNSKTCSGCGKMFCSCKR